RGAPRGDRRRGVLPPAAAGGRCRGGAGLGLLRRQGVGGLPRAVRLLQARGGPARGCPTPGPAHPLTPRRLRAASAPAWHGGRMPSPSPVISPETLAAFERYLAAERGRSAHTVRAYLGDVRDLAAALERAGVPDLSDVDINDLRSWLGEQAAAGAARSTIARRA